MKILSHQTTNSYPNSSQTPVNRCQWTPTWYTFFKLSISWYDENQVLPWLIPLYNFLALVKETPIHSAEKQSHAHTNTRINPNILHKNIFYHNSPAYQELGKLGHKRHQWPPPPTHKTEYFITNPKLAKLSKQENPSRIHQSKLSKLQTRKTTTFRLYLYRIIFRKKCNDA